MKIGFLTTSRADFSIYTPLLRAIDEHLDFEYAIFAGGTHLSEQFGLTYKLIEESGFEIEEKVSSMMDDDSPKGISGSMGLTFSAFTEVWGKHASQLDILFVLGDRYEMFAATAATLPYSIQLAHLHGGETTLGAIDNKFRNAISAMADYHFVSAEDHANRVENLIGSSAKIHNVGALGIEAILSTSLLSSEEFSKKFDFNTDRSYVLTTYHPETMVLGQNENNIEELINALRQIPDNILCSLPNADGEGSIIREALLKFERENSGKIKCFENLGQAGYYTAMKNCKMLIGNTSSGIIEAATFDKAVVNVGKRQEGRLAGENVVHVDNTAEDILRGYETAGGMADDQFENLYGGGDTSSQIIKVLERI